MKQAAIVSTARTGLAKSWKGAFNMTHGADLGGHVVQHAVSRAGVDPTEIEDVLMTHPAIAEAVAVGIPSTEWGEAVGIAITIRPDHSAPTDDELRTLVKNRLRSSRVPEQIVLVDDLPYNEMGKLRLPFCC